jgi:hypothetical protein
MLHYFVYFDQALAAAFPVDAGIVGIPGVK